MKLQLSIITMVLLCVISTISSRLKEHEVVGNENTQSTAAAAILDSNPNQSQNEEDFRNQQDESKKVKIKTSKYNGVSRIKDGAKWMVQLAHNKKQYYGGLFENEEHAAMKVNLLCEKLEIEHKNPAINMEPDKIQQVQNQSSRHRYTGVRWNNKEKKWKAQLIHKRKKYFRGFFENEEHAAMEVNLLCEKLGIQRKNPTIDIELDKIHQQFKNQTSTYTDVCWMKDKKRWRAQLTNNQMIYYGGCFKSEEHAAMKVNSLCDELEIERKNPMIIKKLDKIQENFKNQTSSKYIGVSWNEDRKKWRAQLAYNHKKYNGGYFDKEEDAAMSINLLCDKYEVKRKNPTIDIKLFKAHQAQDLTSQYIGVSWRKDKKKWLTQLIHKRKTYSAGLCDNEKYAAMKVNLLCDEFGIKRKNPMIDIKCDAIRRPSKNKTSKYLGVSWNKDKKKWQVILKHNEKLNYGGLFDKEEDAAMKVNLLCDKYEVKRKNPMIDIELFEGHQVRNSTSQYIGVYWDKKNKKWRTLLMHNEKKYFGLFDNEKDAAMELNSLCDELGVHRKNLMIDIELDAIQQKTKSSKMYQSKAENVTNEKEVKVEEENILYGLKGQCENNFMKKSCQSQKRKRKEDLILNNVIAEHMVNTTPDLDQNEVFEEIQKDYIKILD